MGTFYSRDIDKFEKVLNIASFLKKVEYDLDAITYDESRNCKGVKLRTPQEVEETMKATCMDGVFYCAQKLKDYFGERMITIIPLIQRRNHLGRFTDMELGIGHGMYLFQINGYYGAISKSREELLSFVPPLHKNTDSIVPSSQILNGYSKLTDSRDERFLGIAFQTLNIREKFPEYDTDPNKRLKIKRNLRGCIFSKESKRSTLFKRYLKKTLERSSEKY